MSQNNGPISRLVNQGINSVVKPKKAAPPRMAPTAADYLLGRAQVPQPPAQAPNPIANQQRQNAQTVRRMSPGIDRVANPSNERRVQIRANTPGTPENTRELVRRRVAALPIPDDKRAEVEALVDSALFIRTTYIDPETGMRRRVSPLASQNAIRQTGLLDPSDAMEVVELLKTEGGVRLLQTEVKQFQDQRTRGSQQAKGLEALARPGNVDPTIAGVGGVIDALKPVALGVPSELMSRAIQNDPANIAGLLGVGEAVVGTFQDAGLAPFRAAVQPLRMLGVDPEAIERGIRQFGQAQVRGFAGGVSSMTRIPQLLGSKEWADLSDAIDKGIAMRDADKPLDDTFFNEIARTIGGVVPQIAPALLTGGSSIGASVAGRMVASAVFATTEAMSNAVSGFDRAVKEGQNIEEARQRAARALPVDMIVSTALNRFGEFSDLSPLWKKMFASSFSEGVQEWVQTGLEGYVATGELDLSSPEAIKGMALGAALGPWFSAGIDLATGTQMEGGAEAVPQRSAAASVPPVAPPVAPVTDAEPQINPGVFSQFLAVNTPQGAMPDFPRTAPAGMPQPAAQTEQWQIRGESLSQPDAQRLYEKASNDFGANNVRLVQDGTGRANVEVLVSGGSGKLSATRDGDFYQFFGEDARNVARVTGAPLVQQNGRATAGFGFANADRYIEMLQAAGYDVSLGGNEAQPQQEAQAPTQPVAQPQEAAQKEPWQMTRGEYLAQQVKDFEELVAQSRKKLEDAKREDPDSQSIHVLESVLAFQQNVLKDLRRGKDAGPTHLHHRVIVNGNLAKGLPVPPEVLADYPDLAAKYQPQSVAQTPANAPSLRKVAEGVARPAQAETPTAPVQETSAPSATQGGGLQARRQQYLDTLETDEQRQAVVRHYEAVDVARAQVPAPVLKWLDSATPEQRTSFTLNKTRAESLVKVKMTPEDYQRAKHYAELMLSEVDPREGKRFLPMNEADVPVPTGRTMSSDENFITEPDANGVRWWTNTHLATRGVPKSVFPPASQDKPMEIQRVIPKEFGERVTASAFVRDQHHSGGSHAELVVILSNGARVNAKYWRFLQKNVPGIAYYTQENPNRTIVAHDADGNPVALLMPMQFDEEAAKLAQPAATPQPAKTAQSQESARPQPATTPKPELAPDTAQEATKKANADLRRKVQSSGEPSQQDVNALQREYASKGYAITRNSKGEYIITKTKGGVASSTPGKARFGLLRMYSFDAVRDVDAVIAEFESYETAAKADEALVEYAKDKQPHELTYAEIEQFSKVSRLGEDLERAMLERYFYSLPAEQRRTVMNSDEWPSQYSHRMAVEEAYGSGMDVPANVLEELGMTGAPRSAYKRTNTPSPVVAPKPAPKVAEPTPQPNLVAVQPGVFPISNARPVQKRDHIIALYPNRVGGKFSPSDIEAVKEWAQSEQATVVASPTVITVTGPLGKNWAATAVKAVESVRGLTVRQARNKAAVDQYNQRVEAKNAADKAYIAANPDVAKWLASVFGDNFANPHNQAALIRYLVGDAKKFDGGMNPSWVPGLEKLGLNSSNASNLKTNDIAAVIKQAWQAQSQKAPAKAPESVSPGVQQAEGSTAGVTQEYKPVHHVAVYSGKAVMLDGTKPKNEEFRSAAMRVYDNAGEGFVIAPDGSVWAITKSSRKAKPASVKEAAEAVAIAKKAFGEQTSGAKVSSTAGVADTPAQKQPDAQEQVVYRYAPRLRPPSPGAVPREGLIGTARGGEWGVAEYNRELTPQEIRDYELDVLPPRREAVKEAPRAMTMEEREAVTIQGFRPDYADIASLPEGKRFVYDPTTESVYDADLLRNADAAKLGLRSNVVRDGASLNTPNSYVEKYGYGRAADQAYAVDLNNGEATSAYRSAEAHAQLLDSIQRGQERQAAQSARVETEPKKPEMWTDTQLMMVVPTGFKMPKQAASKAANLDESRIARAWQSSSESPSFNRQGYTLLKETGDGNSKFVNFASESFGQVAIQRKHISLLTKAHGNVEFHMGATDRVVFAFNQDGDHIAIIAPAKLPDAKPRTQAQTRADAKKRDAALQDLVYGTPGTVIEKRLFTDTVVSYDKKQGTVVVSRTEDGRNMGQFPLMGGLDKRDVVSITAPDGTVLYANRKLTDAAKERVEAMLAPKKPKPQSPAEPKVAGGTSKQPWQMTRRDWDEAMDALRPDPNGEYGNRMGGMGRATTERGFKAQAQFIESEKRRLRMGLPPKYVVYAEDGSPIIVSKRPTPTKGQFLDDWQELIVSHRDVVEEALNRGLPVPSEVLADYPDLASKQAKPQSPAEPKVVAEEPWQMTAREYNFGSGLYAGELLKQARDAGLIDEEFLGKKDGQGYAWSAHKMIVATALKRGLPVPPEVLADYPDLAAQQANPQSPDILASPSKPAKSKDTITVDGKERPRTNSNGQPIHPTEEGIRAFWKWFGDSKVVDEQGRPLVVYKGMTPYKDLPIRDSRGNIKASGNPTEIDVIQRPERFPSFDKDEGLSIAGFFGDAETASRFAQIYQGGVYPVYLKIETPYVDSTGRKAGVIQFEASGRPFREAMRSGRYDGAIMAKTPDEGTIYIALDPTQIKSATGNQGTFSPDNPSILASPQSVVVNKGNVQAKTQGPTGATPIAWKIVPIPHNGPTIHLDQLTELGVKAFGQGIVGTSATGTKGAFVLTSGTLYVKKSNDHITYAHEGAHRLDQQYKITDALIGSPAHAELDSGHFDHTVPTNASASVKTKEQFAAFMEAYVSDPSTLNTVAPNMVKAFEASVPKETVDAIRKFSEGLRRYAGQDPEAKVKGSFLAPTTPKTFVQMAADNVQGLVTDENLDAAAREVFDEYAPFVRTVDRMVGRGDMDAGRAKRKGERGITDNPNDLEVALREVPYTEQMLEDAIRKGMLNRLVSVKTGKTTRTTKSLLAILEPFGVRGKNQDVFMENWRDFEAYIASMRHLDFARRQTKIAAENVKNYKDVLAERLKQKKAAAKMRADSDLQAELLRIARDPSLTNAQRKAKERVLVDAHKARVARAYMRLEAGAKGALTTYTKHQNAEAKRRGEQSGIAVPYGVPGVDSTIQVANETIKRLQQDKKKWARLKQAEKDLREFSFTMIDNLEWAGILAPEQAQSIKDNNPYWFAIQRVEDPVTEPTITDLLHYGQSGLQAKNPVHALVGSSKSKQDVISALVGRVALTIDSAARNRVAQVTANWLNANGLPDGTDGEIIRVRKSDGIDATTPNTFKFYDHGQEVVWQVHPKNAALIDSLNRVGSLQSDKLDKLLWDVVASATTMTHRLIVSAPPFIARNLFRDTKHRISMIGGNPLDTFLPKDKHGMEFKDAFGMGLGRSTVLTNRETYERNQRKVMKELTQQGNVIYQIGRGYHALQAKAEEANRLVVYKDAYKKFRAMGRTEYEADLLAFYAAREGMVDFKKAGVTARKVSRFIPFFNAAIAGQRTTGTQLRNNPGKVAVRMMEIAVVGIALEQAFAAMGGDDEEKRLAGLSPYQREMFWNFRIGGDEGFWLSIPKGHEQAVGISMVERMHEVARGREVETGRSLTTLRDNTLPVSRFEDALGGWKALFEIGFNRSLHNMKTIVPDHERGLAMDARKGTQYASPVGQGMAGVFRFGDPRQWDHAIENMTGYYGRIVTELSEAKTLDEYIRALSRLTGLTMPGSLSQNEDVIAVDNLLSSIGVRPPGWDALKDSFYDAPDEASRQRAARRLIDTAVQWRKRLEPIMERNPNVRKDVAKQYLEAVGGYN